MKNCYKCKVAFCPKKNRAFHLLPKDDHLKEKWLSILGLPPVINKNSVYICSDHFSSDCYEKFVGQTRKRLRQGALPLDNEQINSDNPTIKSVDASPVPPPASLLTVNSSIENDEKRQNKIILPTENIDASLVHLSPNLVAVNRIIDNDRSPIEMSETCNDDSSQSNIIEDDSCAKENNAHDKAKESNVQLFDNTPLLDLIESEKSSQIVCNQNNVRKRKAQFQSSSPPKRVKFMDGSKVQYFSRSDCVSDEAWEKFLKFKKIQDSKVNASRNKTKRSKKKVISLQDIIKTFKSNNEENVATFLQVI